VEFDGVPIGHLTGWDWEAKAGEVHETTNVTSPVIGSGANARVQRQYDCTSVEPPTLNITFKGPPSFTMDDRGLKANLVFTAPGASLSGEAILLSFAHSGRVNQWSEGTASFQLTGLEEA
jgi:hypothetical protein